MSISNSGMHSHLHCYLRLLYLQLQHTALDKLQVFKTKMCLDDSLTEIVWLVMDVADDNQEN